MWKLLIEGLRNFENTFAINKNQESINQQSLNSSDRWFLLAQTMEAAKSPDDICGIDTDNLPAGETTLY